MLTRARAERKGRSRMTVVRDLHDGGRRAPSILSGMETSAAACSPFPRRPTRSSSGTCARSSRSRRSSTSVVPRTRLYRLPAGAEPPDPRLGAAGRLRAAAPLDPPRRAHAGGRRAARPRAAPDAGRRGRGRRDRSRSAASSRGASRSSGSRSPSSRRAAPTSRSCARAYEALHAEFAPPPEIAVRPVNAGGVPVAARLGRAGAHADAPLPARRRATCWARRSATGRSPARSPRPRGPARSCPSSGSRPSTRSPPRSRTPSPPTPGWSKRNGRPGGRRSPATPPAAASPSRCC